MDAAPGAALAAGVTEESTRPGRPAAPAGPPPSGRVPWKPLLLPSEHGGWGLLAEPALLGLILAPTGSSWALAGCALLAFLARHPLKLAVSDRLRGVHYPRTSQAWIAGGAYALAAGALLALALALSSGPLWAPLLVAGPLAFGQFLYDARLKGRALAPELLGAAALCGIAAAMALGGGRSWLVALCAWLLLTLRSIASVTYVRARLLTERGQGASPLPPLALHAAGLGSAIALAGLTTASWLAALAFVLLTARAVHGLSQGRIGLAPRKLGFAELGYGLVSTALIAAALLPLA